MRLRPLVLVALFAVALTPASPVLAQAPEQRHASGIVLLPPLDVSTFGPVHEPLAVAWSDAWHLAETHPDDFGYPSEDRANKTLRISVVTPAGEALARKWMRDGELPAMGVKPAPAPRVPQVRVEIRPVDRSFAQLERLKDGVTRPSFAGFSGDPRIWSSAPDPAYNRVVFETDRVSDEFLHAVAKMYGTEAITVRVDPRAGLAGDAPWPTVDPFSIWPTAAVAGLTLVAAAFVIIRRGAD